MIRLRSVTGVALRLPGLVYRHYGLFRAGEIGRWLAFRTSVQMAVRLAMVHWRLCRELNKTLG